MRFAAWLAQQEVNGRAFSSEQLMWLEAIRDHLALSLQIELDDFDYPPFAQRGGIGRASEVFGAEWPPVGGIERGIGSVTLVANHDDCRREQTASVLPLGWAMSTLGEIFRWGSAGTPPVRYRSLSRDIPWAIIGDLTDGVVNQTHRTISRLGLENSSAKMIEPGSVLIAMYGSIGKLGLTGIPMATNQAIAFTKPDPIDARFLFWYLRSIRDDLMRLGKGGTQLNISQTVLKAVPFPVAPLAEQHRIVAEIETQFTRLDAAVGALERAWKKLNSIGQRC